MDRHPENEPLAGVIAFRPEASLIYVNAESVFDAVLDRLRATSASEIKLVICDLSASPYMDLAGSRMLHDLHSELANRGIALRVVAARGRVRDLLRADSVTEKVGYIDRHLTIDSLLAREGQSPAS
jgi:MFS superfamily sulfate permease-like transporter